MKGKLALFVLLITVLFATVGTICATDVNQIDDAAIISDNDEIAVSDNSTDLSINNKQLNNGIENSGVQDKQDVNLSAPDIELYYKNGTNFTIKLSDNEGNPLANQNITTVINGGNYYRITDENGFVYIKVNLSPGTYDFNVSYGGSDLYNPINTHSTVKVLSTITGENLTKYYLNGSQYTAKFLDGQGNPLAGATVKFNIDGVFYSRVTDENGYATLTINLRPSKLIVTGIHPVNGQMFTNIVTVLSTISGNDLTKAYLSDKQYYAHFVDSTGAPLAGTNVKFNIDGIFYNRVTDSNGDVEFVINLRPGTFIITAIHPNGQMYSNTIKVLKDVPTYIVVNNASIIKGFDDKVEATLYDNLGNRLANKTISVSIADKNYNLITDSKGTIIVPIEVGEGEYDIIYNYGGSYAYASSSNRSTLKYSIGIPVTIESQDAIIYTNKSEYFSVKVTDIEGNPIVNKNVIFTIDGVQYTRLTNEKGIASILINLRQGIFEIISSFNEVGYINKNTTSTVIVLKDGSTTLTPISNEIYQGNTYEIILKAGDVPLSNRTVHFTIDGINYTRVTNSYGIASLNINLRPDTFEIKYYFEGDDRLNPSNGTSNLVIKSKTGTSLKNISDTSFTEGNNVFSVKLTDIYGNSLSNCQISFNIDGVVYTALTNNQGIASLDINLRSGEYYITYSFEGNLYYIGTSGSSNIIIVTPSSNSKAYGYWLFGGDMYNADLSSLSSLGTNTIFLNAYAFEKWGESKVVSWIKTANNYGIKVHIWMQVFYDGEWISPVNSDGSINYNHINEVAKTAAYYASLSGVSGVHLDYLRFPGTAYKYTNGALAVTTAAQYIHDAVKKVNSNCIVSAAVMPETSNDKYYYGQDIPSLTKYLDAIVPMAYKGNYGAGTTWLNTVTSWFVKNSNCQVWIGLQAYKSDSNVAKLSLSELTNDAQNVLNSGASGVLSFRWGISNFLDFNNLKVSNTPQSQTTGNIDINSIKSTANDLKKYIESNGILPDTLKINDKEYTIEQFLYLMAKTLVNQNSNNYNDIIAINVEGASSPSGDGIYGKIFKEEYIDIANSIIEYIDQHNKAPDNINSSLGEIRYSTLVYMYSKTLAYLNNYNTFPAFVYVTDLLENYTLTVVMYPSASGTISSGQYQYKQYSTTFLNYCPKCGYYGTLLVNPKGTVEGELTCSYCDSDYCGVSGLDKLSNSKYCLTKVSESVLYDEINNNTPTEENKTITPGDDGDSISINDIITAAQSVKSYYSSNGKFADYVIINSKSYSLAQFLYLITAATNKIYNNDLTDIKVIEVGNASSSLGDTINSFLSLTDYLDVASRVSKFCVDYSQAPNYASSSLGKISFYDLVDAFSRVLNYYGEHNALPNTVAIVNNVEDNNETIQYGSVGDVLSIKDILTAAQYVKNYYSENNAFEEYVMINSKYYSMAQFLYLMSTAINNINQSNFNNITVVDVADVDSSSGDSIDSYLNMSEYLDVSKRVSNYCLNIGQAPNYASSSLGKISYYALIDGFSRILNYYATNNALPNTVNIDGSVTNYVTSGAVAKKAAELTKGLTSAYDKAVAIYNFVRSSITYSFYYNTQYGAEGTLTRGYGNCCDQAQLLVAMGRSLGLTCRFATGTCTFSSGSTYGHVWAQFYINGAWINADPTSNRNSFGVIKNWNTASYTSKGTYEVLPY